ncbi:hypothetical protein ACFLQJ_02870, partial [Calditrichota bacterium]
GQGDNQGNRNRGRGQWEYNRDSERVFNVLSAMLSNNEIVMLRKSIAQLAAFLNIPGFTLGDITTE